MTKIRVHELAKEFGIASKEMEAKIKEMGYSIKNYMSTLEDYEVEEIRRRLRGEEPSKEEKPKVVVRRRHQVVRLKKVVRRPKEEQAPEAEAQVQQAKGARSAPARAHIPNRRSPSTPRV